MTKRCSVAMAVTFFIAIAAHNPSGVIAAVPNRLPIPILSQSDLAGGYQVIQAAANTSLPPSRRHYATSRSKAYSRFVSSRRLSLPSRGASDEASAGSHIIGRVAQVTSATAQIKAGPDRWGRVLSVCAKGQYIGVSSETDTQYGVIMIDNSIGYINKADVQLLDEGVVSSNNGAQQTLGQRLVQSAWKYMRVRYAWGGNTMDGIDCSGLVKAVFSENGIELPRHSGDQAAVGYDVPLNDLSVWMPGDRMYFACHHPEIDHTAIYIGNGLFIHASMGNNQQVWVDRVDNGYYWRHLVCVRRSKELLGDSELASRQTTVTSLPSSSPQPAERPQTSTQGSAATVTAATATANPTYSQTTTAPNDVVSSGPTTPDVSATRTVPPAASASASVDPESNQQ